MSSQNGWFEGRADTWAAAADMLEDMCQEGNSPELMLTVFRAIALDARDYSDRVNARVSGSQGGHSSGRE